MNTDGHGFLKALLSVLIRVHPWLKKLLMRLLEAEELARIVFGIDQPVGGRLDFAPWVAEIGFALDGVAETIRKINAHLSRRMVRDPDGHIRRLDEPRIGRVFQCESRVEG